MHRLLLVDDDASITEILKRGLERKGYAVDAYNDPRSALDQINPEGYAIAIFDIRMPGMNGFEVYREFRKVDGNAIICFLTSFEVGGQEFEKLFPDIRASAFFKKPIGITELAANLEQLVKRQRIADEKG